MQSLAEPISQISQLSRQSLTQRARTSSSTLHLGDTIVTLVDWRVSRATRAARISSKRVLSLTPSRWCQRVFLTKMVKTSPSCPVYQESHRLTPDFTGVRRIFVDEPAQYLGCTGSNSINENISDLKAQIAANKRGTNLINELFGEYGGKVVQTYMAAIQQNAENAVRNHLKRIAKLHPKPLVASDALDDGTEIHLKITIDPATGSAVFDFAGTMYQTYGNYNAPPSLVRSAIIYVLRCIINDDIPLNQGCLAPIEIVIPEGTILSPSPGAAVFSGNSSTSSRMTDVILKAFEACAASQGTMNGIQMYGVEKAKPGEPFAGYKFMYGETICGGSGAGPTWHGVSGVHTVTETFPLSFFIYAIPARRQLTWLPSPLAYDKHSCQ